MRNEEIHTAYCKRVRPTLAQLGKIKEAYGENVKTRIVDRVGAGPGARAKVLGLEKANADRLRGLGQLDKDFHNRP